VAVYPIHPGLIAPRFILIAGLLLLPLVVPGMYWQRVIAIVCIYALLAVGFDFLAHYVGLVSLQSRWDQQGLWRYHGPFQREL